MEGVSKHIMRCLLSTVASFDSGEGFQLVSAGKYISREPLITVFFFLQDGEALDHGVCSKALQQGQGSLCVKEDGAVVSDDSVLGREGGRKGRRRRG